MFDRYHHIAIARCRQIVVALIAITVAAHVCNAQSPDTSSPVAGRYCTVRLQADGPGLVRLRAPESLGVDWPAPGRGFVNVPWMTWRESSSLASTESLSVEINGQPATIALTPRPSQANDPLLGPADAMPNERAYVPTTAWAPGRDESVRRWAVGAAVASVLVIAAVALATQGRRGSVAAMVVASLGTTALLAVTPALNKRDASRRVGVAIDSGRMHQDVWVYRVAREAMRVDEPWGGDAGKGESWFVPRSLGHVSRADPVLSVDAAGRPLSMNVGVGPDDPAAFLHRTLTTAKTLPAIDDGVESPELARRLYGNVGQRDHGWTRITR